MKLTSVCLCVAVHGQYFNDPFNFNDGAVGFTQGSIVPGSGYDYKFTVCGYLLVIPLFAVMLVAWQTSLYTSSSCVRYLVYVCDTATTTATGAAATGATTAAATTAAAATSTGAPREGTVDELLARPLPKKVMLNNLKDQEE